LKACNLQLSPNGRKLGMEELFEDWAAMAREMKRLPSNLDYGARSRYSTRPLRSRLQYWKQVPAAMKQHMEEHGLLTEWADVVALIDREASREAQCDSGYRAMLGSGIEPK